MKVRVTDIEIRDHIAGQRLIHEYTDTDGEVVWFVEEQAWWYIERKLKNDYLHLSHANVNGEIAPKLYGYRVQTLKVGPMLPALGLIPRPEKKSGEK